jgi:hypothetical protein
MKREHALVGALMVIITAACLLFAFFGDAGWSPLDDGCQSNCSQHIGKR